MKEPREELNKLTANPSGGFITYKLHTFNSLVSFSTTLCPLGFIDLISFSFDYNLHYTLLSLVKHNGSRSFVTSELYVFGL